MDEKHHQSPANHHGKNTHGTLNGLAQIDAMQRAQRKLPQNGRSAHLSSYFHQRDEQYLDGVQQFKRPR